MSDLIIARLVGIILRPIDSEVIQRRRPHLISLAKDVKLVFTPFPTGIEPRAVTWQSITLPLRHATSTPFVLYATTKTTYKVELIFGYIYASVYKYK